MRVVKDAGNGGEAKAESTSDKAKNGLATPKYFGTAKLMVDYVKPIGQKRC